MKNIWHLLSLLLLFSLSSCEDESPLSISSISLDEYTPEQNLIIGNSIDEEAAKNYPTLKTEDNPEVMEYLNTMLQILINTATIEQRELYNWQISVIPDTTQSTLFSLPNGHIYIYTGLLNFLSSESQLLSLLAHEIYFIDQGIMVELIEDEFSAQELGDILLDNGKANVERMAQSLSTLKANPQDVLAADAYAVEVLCPFVYEPRGIVKIIDRARLDWTVAPKWFDLRPVDDIVGRIDNMNRIAEPCGLDGVKNVAEYQDFLEMLPL